VCAGLCGAQLGGIAVCSRMLLTACGKLESNGAAAALDNETSHCCRYTIYRSEDILGVLTQ
jgi:hypothetical protein